MIESLHVKDLAVVEDARIAFGPGLNIVTGETGAGKSVLMGAIDLLRGGRADHSLVRAGATQCLVEAAIRPGAAEPAVQAILAELGLPPCEDGLLLLRRTVAAADSSGRCFVNDAPSTVQTLRRLGPLLIDLHGPHDNQSLFDPATQLAMLDAVGGVRDGDDARAYAALFEKRRALLARRDELSGGDPEARAREIDMLSYQVDEIRAASLTDDDGEALVREHTDVANAARLWEIGREVTQLLSDGEPSAFDLLVSAQTALGEMERILPDAREWHDEARELASRLQELSRAVEGRVEAIDASPERLAALEERMSLVKRLERKYGGSLEAVRAFLEKAAARLTDLTSLDERRAECERDIAAAEAAMRPVAEALSARRRAAGVDLEIAVNRELRDLGFANARFRADIAPAPFAATGADAVEFAFAPNPGEPEHALRDVASSGEIARVMLALKTVLAGHDRVPVLIFDEIDANIGGETGNAVGAKMRQIGDLGHQVLCITHLTQVAVYGRSHFVVRKGVEGGRTVTTIAPVEGEARVQEIARMLGGAGITTVALDHARQMLER